MEKSMNTATGVENSPEAGTGQAVPQTPVLAFEDVTMTYGGLRVFAHFNLWLLPGRVLGVRGPSGSGKSTLLKMAAGLIPPAEGRVTLPRGPIGYVFQEPRLIPWYTALENICLAMTACGHPKAAARETAAGLLSDMGLESFENHYPRQLSGGMNQRVSIARALAVKPVLLLLDEPFTGLDPAMKSRVRDNLSRVVSDQGISVMHVTHDTRELLPQTREVVTLGQWHDPRRFGPTRYLG